MSPLPMLAPPHHHPHRFSDDAKFLLAVFVALAVLGLFALATHL